MRRVGGIVSLTGIAVAIALATLAGQARQGGTSRARGKALHDLAVLRGRCAFLAILRARSDQQEERGEARRWPGAFPSPATASSIPSSSTA